VTEAELRLLRSPVQANVVTFIPGNTAAALARFEATGHELAGPPRGRPLPGRNDPCFCGSGKKFKKCYEGPRR
jgi:uncharacterized protein YecA (UPF0149 family)